jgi:phosphoribosylanthranilate isomerase
MVTGVENCCLIELADSATVADAIRTVKPFGIDVSSGVESSPGIKDHTRLRALFDAVAAVNVGAP